jgi:hypothetical protein
MTLQQRTGNSGYYERAPSTWNALATVLLALALLLPLAPARLAPQAWAAAPQSVIGAPSALPAVAVAEVGAAATDVITLRVVNARTEPLALDGGGVIAGEPVTTPYKFLINVDNAGDPFDDTDCFAYLDPPDNTIRNPNYPDGCDWPGVRTNPGWSPIYTQGDQDDLNETTGIQLPPGNYLISVMAEGYKVDGEHFTIPMEEPGLIEVGVQPYPLPPASMVIKVFHDRSLTNSQFDAPVEQSVCPGEMCMAGFRVSLNDIMGEITVDMFGNPLCTEYERDGVTGEILFDEDGAPIPIVGTGGECLSDETGTILIPNIGPIRYDVLVTPPDGETWIQTTTLEGSHGWDTWLQEGGTGLDNEFIVAAEPFPWTIFGFVKPSEAPLPPVPNGGSIEGVIMGITTYSPSQGGLPHQGDIWGGLMGAKLDEPIAYPWLSLNSLQDGDTAIWVGEGNADGSFRIDNVPPGDYFLSYWDLNQHYILDFVQLSVQPNQVTDIGIRTMTNWFTKWFGVVFHDYNENGRQDPGEPGVPDYVVVLRDRDNTEIDRMSIASVTDAQGRYALEKGYPMSSWMVLEAYNDLYRTTGVTYQASNALEETTVLGPIVDVNVLPIFSQWGRLDWGVTFYEPGTNGGIAGTVFYDTARAEDDARYAGAEPWQPGIPALEMRLYATVKDAQGDFVFEADGSYMKGPLLATTVTEDYVRPKDCQPLDVDGNPVDFPALPPSTGGYDCLEAPMMGVQFGNGQAELPGNYGFGEIEFDPLTGDPLAEPLPIPPGDYLVEVVIPTDPVFGRPLYQVTREEDVNIYDGDVFLPQILPPACAGPLHVVDVAGIMPDGPNAVENPGYVEVGGSRFEGMEMPLCNVKLVSVVDRKSIAPIFTLWTEVPIPGRWRGYIIDDLNVSSNPLEMFFGEKAGLPYMPIGIYDFTGRLVHTVHSDFHGVYEVILPSMANYNAPTPSGMFAGMYYIYGNDPGQPGSFNERYHPGYRSIGTSFEVYPGVTVPSDLAPTQNGALIWAPDSLVSQLAACKLDEATPELYAVSQPYIQGSGLFTIWGKGFGAQRGQGQVRLGNWILPVNSWSDHELVVRVPGGVSPGAYQLTIRADNLQSTVNGLTFHVLGAGYSPTVFEVGPGKEYDTIQSALDDAAEVANALVVVYPGTSILFDNPLGFWLENPIIYSPVKLQGVGPGGVYADGSGVQGSILDGRGMGGTEDYAEWWRLFAGDIWLNRGGWDGSPVDGDGNPRLYEGAVITVFAEDGEFTSGFAAGIDGFRIQGGDQQGFPNNLNQIGGGRIPGVPAEVVVQGGGIFVNGYARHLRITNNLIENNGGAYAGAIRLGTPDVPAPFTDHQNDNLVIARNRIIGNGGTNLAGAIGVFAGAENYEIAYNDICGNFSAEYGGGISHYGLSPNGSIHHNRIYFNRSYDEGGGVMVAGELPAIAGTLSPGAGPVNVYANLIQANLANDDGGGLRFLMAGNYLYNVYNNIIANNVSTHEGGGISLNDAPNVRIYNNTIVKNLTTATAMTSNGLPAPAGLSTSRNSNMLQATLPGGAPVFSDPLLFNNIFWDNRAGTWTGGGVAGIGLQGDPSPAFYWDLGVAGMQGLLSPTYSLLQTPYGAGDPTNIVGVNPQFVAEYDSSVRVYPWRGNPNFVGADIVAFELPPNLMGDYRLATGSPAINAGASSKSGIMAPNQDIEAHPRPSQGRFEIGADETGQGFPVTPPLFPGAGGADLILTASMPGASVELPFKTWLPITRGGSAPPPGDFGGDPTSFEFDPVTGITVTESGHAVWNPATFGSDQEAFFTFVAVSPTATRQDLLLKMDGLTVSGGLGPDTRLINVGYDATTTTVHVSTLEPGDVWVTHESWGGIEFAPGDQFGARAASGGIVQVFQNGALIGWADLAAGPTPWPYNDQGGRIGFWFVAPSFDGPDAAIITDFGGGTTP